MTGPLAYDEVRRQEARLSFFVYFSLRTIRENLPGHRTFSSPSRSGM